MPVCVVSVNPFVDRSLGCLDRGEHSDLVEKFASQRPVEPLDPAGGGR